MKIRHPIGLRHPVAEIQVSGCLICEGHFPQKSPIISGSFAKRDLQLKGSCTSSSPCHRDSGEWMPYFGGSFSEKEPYD